MRKQGNHMVDLPQPELDREPHCDHNHYDVYEVAALPYFGGTIELKQYPNGVEKGFEMEFEIICRDCGVKGLVHGAVMIDIGQEEWD
tara:strand:+ start:467 stop:727 length:261 start_codon:yes stop_codon:yes gene_type:complete